MAPSSGTEVQEPEVANDTPSSGSKATASARVTWSSWAAVPRDAHQVAAAGPWFVEIYSGTARLTSVLLELGVKCLPPIDVVTCGMVPSPFDVVDADNWDFILQVAALGGISFIHFGTPCNTFSAARKEDGGPPPLRSALAPEGLETLSGDNAALVFLGNLFLYRTVELALVVYRLGGNFSIENPLFSLMWEVPCYKDLALRAHIFEVDFDQCMWGAPSMKPTRLACSHEMLSILRVRCDGCHPHIKLKGQVWSTQFKRWVFRTKLAQEYPWQMCQAMAHSVVEIMEDKCSHFADSFRLQDVGDRKRPLGQLVPFREHKQALTALFAQAAGYQLKRGALKPLLDVETTPGAAIEWALSIPHPLSAALAVDEDLQAVLQAIAQRPQEVLRLRQVALQHWQQRALDLLPVTARRLEEIVDPHLRFLLRGVPDSQAIQLGSFCHVALYEEMLQTVQSCDQDLPAFLLQGFPIVGPIARSGRWANYTKAQEALPIQEAVNKAWEIRKKIVARVQAVAVSENLAKIWEATEEDIREGSTLGPFFDHEKVSEVVGTDKWIPTQRFEVVQKNKVRGCDSATTNLINPITVITEKLQLPSTDSNVAALRVLRSLAPGEKLAGWVLDERKAYRQVAIAPEHRRFSVICLKEPSSGRPAFFVMVGHSFGLVSAVYNYNRRSAAINEILVKLFGLAAFSFYDDKYGFETVKTIDSAHHIAQCVHWWLGALFDKKKLQISRAPTILGVTYNLEEMHLEIKADRKTDLLEEIDCILRSDSLEPGLAGKLKGKLMFGASQLWGKIGRAFLRVVSERQYARFPCSDRFALDPPLKEALNQWRKLIKAGPPRPIDFRVDKKADVVIFTDGFTPDPRSNDRKPDRIGAVMFDRRLLEPIQFTSIVPDQVKRKWLQRKTQIVPVEMVAPIVALVTFADRLRGKDLLLFIDSEAVEGALVKGYSSKEDLCLLVSVFWDLVFELQITVFIDRVATDANPADWPSRGDLKTGRSAGWLTVEPRWPDSLSE